MQTNGYVIDKYLTPIARMKCSVHKRENVNFVCTDTTCQKRHVICKLCKTDDEQHYAEHKQDIKSLENFVAYASKEIENNYKGNKTVFNEVFSQGESQNLLRWQEEHQAHMRKMEDHLIAQKVLIAEDMANIMAAFGDTCQKIQESMFLRLDEYLTFYKDNFMSYRQVVEESFALTQSFSYYMNPNNLVAKLQSETPPNANEFINQILQAIDQSQVVNANKTGFLGIMKKFTTNINRLTENLPAYRLTENFQPLMNSVGDEIQKFFVQNISIPPDFKEFNVASLTSALATQHGFTSPLVNNFPNPSSTNNLSGGSLGSNENQDPKVKNNLQGMIQKDIPSSIGNGTVSQVPSYSVLNDNKNLLWQAKAPGSAPLNIQNTSLVPIKQFQLDGGITALTALSDVHLGLVSNSDTQIRIFETNTQKLHMISAHKDPIIFLTQIITQERFMTNSSSQQSQPLSSANNNNQKDQKKQFTKQVLLVSASNDLSIALWSFDYEMKTQMTVYTQLIGFTSAPQFVLDLQDSLSIVTGDAAGEISVWDYHQSKIIFACKGKHNSKIVSMCLIKKYDRFMVASNDNIITVWKAKYSQNLTLQHPTPDSFTCDQQIFFDFGGINCMTISIRELSLAFIGSDDGKIRIFDWNKKQVLSETIANDAGGVCDLSLIQDGTSDPGSSFNVITLGQNDKSVKLWQFTKDVLLDQYRVNYIQYEAGIYNDDTQSKSKSQILQGTSPQFITTNQRDKELLLYEVSL